MEKLTIILDPAHGEDVPGKRSPDGLHREYKWSREICSMLADCLIDNGFNVEFTNTTDKEIGLTARVRAANDVEAKRKLVISPHNNAAGMGDKWMNARGYSVYTSKGQTASDKYAEIVLQNLRLEFPDLRGRFDKSDGDLDNEANFTVIAKTTCPAMLIEWLFQDNKEDLLLIQDDSINERFVSVLVDSIIAIDKIY